ncbi:TetR/AcrR family transcriptional regulator [Ferrimonas marina]|uniref:Transcriptional regulator, TetR family n=1 Tax=Ferrimonas marina TaxID=299255 RepID=A0A1M5YTK5_9GAMM|nr:TetR/AcrR family transcriptional regulator [Ferrimonas marina]SHI14893.1 transcriptional regulator, TetR family [Ferrimonas marina]
MTRVRTNKPSEQRREEFLDAAEQLFMQQGYDSTSVNDLLKAVGLSKGAFYHHFDSKQAVLEALTDRMLTSFAPHIQGLIDDPALPALEKWRALMSQSNRWKLEHKDALLLQARAMHQGSNLKLRLTLTEKTRRLAVPLYAQLLAQGAREGVFDIEQPEATAELLFALLAAQGERITEILLAPDSAPEPVEACCQLLAASQQALERTLAAPAGSLPLADPALIAAWFE